jgi:hypothetical protein
MSTADESAKPDALRQSGVLTQAEFDAEKAKLIRGIVVPPVSHMPQPNGDEAPQGEGWWQDSDGKRTHRSFTPIIGRRQHRIRRRFLCVCAVAPFCLPIAAGMRQER